MIVAIDYDGILADTNRQKVKWIKKNLGMEIDPWNCNRTDCVPIIGREAYERMGWELYEREMSLQAPEVPGALAAVRHLAGKADLHVVTARPPRIMEFAREWLHKKEIFDFLASIRSSDGSTKSEVCAGIGARVLIDDDLRHLCDGGTDGLVRVFLQDGRNNAPAAGTGFVFCRSWEEVVGVIEKSTV